MLVVAMALHLLLRCCHCHAIFSQAVSGGFWWLAYMSKSNYTNSYVDVANYLRTVLTRVRHPSYNYVLGVLLLHKELN